MGIVTEAVAGVVRLPGSSLDSEAPLRNIGIDSLMALEIRNQLQDRAGVTLPLVTIVEGPSIAELVTILLPALDASSASVAIGMSGSGDLEVASFEPAPGAAELDDLSDESVDAMLRRMLAEK
jgi:hypothetical protein